MPLISYRERHRRMRDCETEAWETANELSNDPGLRDTYASLPRAPIRLIACPLSKDVNHGGILRVADAFRLERVDLSREEDNAMDFAGNRGTRARQPHRWVDSPEEAVREAKAEGYAVVAMHLGPDSVPLASVKWSFPVALVLGTEKHGMPPELLDLCDIQAAIPMYGLVTSMNVAVAAALAVQAAHTEYVRLHPSFLPARSASKALLGSRAREL